MLLVHRLDQLVELLFCNLGTVCSDVLKIVADVLHSDFHVFLELVDISSLLENCRFTKLFFELTEKRLLCILRRIYCSHLKLIC